MIVKYVWHTEKRMPSDFKYEGNWYTYRTRGWAGWFFLGIIPLYIKCTANIYHR